MEQQQRWTGRLYTYWKTSFEHLPLSAYTYLLLLLLAIFATKFAAVAFAFPHEGPAQRLGAFAISLPIDFLCLAGCFAVVLLSNFISIRMRWLRAGLAFVISTAFAAMLSATYISLELFERLGSPLKYHLLLLAPSVGKDMLVSYNIGALNIVLALAGAVLICVLLHTAAVAYLMPRLTSSGRWRGRAWIVPGALAVLGAAGLAVQANDFRAAALRNLTAFAMFLPEQSSSGELAPPTKLEQRIVQGLLGPPRSEGKLAFSVLPPRKYNIVLWVWESVGERYLKDFNPLGEVSTPNLKRLFQQSGIHFSQCHVECPLTIQTAWSLMTGLSPPGRPMVFTRQPQLPQHGPMLPELLKTAGYRTAMFSSGRTEIWGTKKLFDEAHFDVFEDPENLANRNAFQKGDWGVEDRALSARFDQWLGSLDKQTPFFTMLWNIETHYPYTWPGMPDALRAASEKTRYLEAIRRSDEQLGNVYASIAAHGLENDTILIVLGDHGEGQGRSPDRPYERAHSMLVFEDSIHAPLFFFHPALAQKLESREVDLQCSPADVFPTVLDLTQTPLPGNIDGYPLQREYPAVVHYSRSILWWPIAVRAGPFKLLLENSSAAPELYKIPDDPWEAHDLAASEPDTANALMCNLIRMSAARYKSDSSFQYEFFQTGSNDKLRPKVSDLLQPLDPPKPKK